MTFKLSGKLYMVLTPQKPSMQTIHSKLLNMYQSTNLSIDELYLGLTHEFTPWLLRFKLRGACNVILYICTSIYNPFIYNQISISSVKRSDGPHLTL